MKKYNEFLNESRTREVLKNRHSKFKIDDYVKIKGTEKVGIVSYIERYSTGTSYFCKYYVNFNNGERKEYKAKDLEITTKEEYLYKKETEKYNL